MTKSFKPAKLVIPINWENDYFEKIDFSETSEIYGRQNIGFIGGGRPASTMPDASKAKVSRFVNEAHARNLKFNYLLNATCLDNLEFSKKGFKEIHKTLDWLSEINVDIITVTLPFLLEIIKHHYPHFKVSVSVQAQISCLEKALHWQDLGADKLNLSYVDINKDFSEIERITKHVSCETQTIANLICQNRCPFVTLHGNYNAHHTQSKHVMDNFGMEYYVINCSNKSFSNPVEILKSAMIRPEDVHMYENAGVDYIKLVERSLTTPALANIVDAYSKRKFDGNLMDLFPGISKYLVFEKGGLINDSLKYFFQPGKANMFKLKSMYDDLNKTKSSKEFRESFNIHIENSALDGFMDYFLKGNCKRVCSECNYCDTFARKAIKLRVSEIKHKESLGIFERSRESLISGEIFS